MTHRDWLAVVVGCAIFSAILWQRGPLPEIVEPTCASNRAQWMETESVQCNTRDTWCWDMLLKGRKDTDYTKRECAMQVHNSDLSLDPWEGFSRSVLRHFKFVDIKVLEIRPGRRQPIVKASPHCGFHGGYIEILVCVEDVEHLPTYGFRRL